MAKQVESIDVTHLPDLARAADEVRNTNRPRILKRGNEELAILRPIRRTPAGRKRGHANRDAFRAAAGSWKGHLDVDQFIEDNYEQRLVSTRPPAEL